MSQTRIKMTRTDARRRAAENELLLGLYLKGCRELHLALGMPFLGNTTKTAADVFNLAIQRLKVEDELVIELRQFVRFAQSWHDFHKHTEIQCDAICERVAPSLAVLAKYEATEPLGGTSS